MTFCEYSTSRIGVHVVLQSLWRVLLVSFIFNVEHRQGSLVTWEPQSLRLTYVCTGSRLMISCTAVFSDFLRNTRAGLVPEGVPCGGALGPGFANVCSSGAGRTHDVLHLVPVSLLCDGSLRQASRGFFLED